MKSASKSIDLKHAPGAMLSNWGYMAGLGVLIPSILPSSENCGCQSCLKDFEMLRRFDMSTMLDDQSVEHA